MRNKFWRTGFVLFAAVIPGLNLSAVADDWPHWRGPQRNGISAEKGWSDQWPDEGPKVLWKAKVGMGFASFAVADGRVYTTGNTDNTDTIFCFDANTGKEIWKHSYPADLGAKYFEGGTTGTPTVEGDRLYTLSRWGDVFCFEAATGKIIWNRNLHKDHGVNIPTWGFSGSPTVQENLVMLNVGDAGMTLDKETGKTMWGSSNEKEAGYSTPLPVKRDGKWQALLGVNEAYLAVDLKTGKPIWRMKWLTQYGVNAADPVVDGDYVFISSGYGKGSALLKPTGKEEPEVVWKSKVLRTQLNPAVLINGHLYGMDGDTVQKPQLKCIEFKTGKQVWAESGLGSGGLIAANGKLIIQAEQGELIVAPATPEGFKPIARAQVLGGKSWTAPVLANGKIYCRNSRGDVVCVDVKGAN